MGKYKKDLEEKFDIREELRNFKYCKSIGVEHVIPLIERNTTPHEFKACVKKLTTQIGGLESGPNSLAHFAHRTQITRLRKASGFSDINPELDDYDRGSVWALLGKNYELPPIPKPPVAIPEPEDKIVEPTRKADIVPEKPAVNPTYFRADYPSKPTLNNMKYVSTRFPSTPVKPFVSS